MPERLLGPKMFEARLLVRGFFGPENLSGVLINGKLQPPSELQDAIDENWAPREQKGWKSFPLLQVDNYALGLVSGTLFINFVRTEGKDFIGASNWALWRDRGLPLDMQRLPNPLVTSSVIVTADGKMIIQVRGANAHQSGNIDALGGHLDIDKDVDDQRRVNFVQSALREVQEESGLRPEHVTNVNCLGLIYNYHDTSHYAMPFVVETGLTAEELVNLERSEEEKKQVNLMVVEPNVCLSDDPSNVKNVIRRYYPNVDPEARITIALATAYMRGKFSQRCQYQVSPQAIFDQIS